MDNIAELRCIGNVSDEDDDTRVRLIVNLARDHEVFERLGVRLNETTTSYTRVSDEEIKEHRRDRGSHEVRDALIDALRHEPGTIRQLAGHVGLTEPVTAGHLRELERQGRAQHTGKGSRGDPYIYELREDIE